MSTSRAALITKFFSSFLRSFDDACVCNSKRIWVTLSSKGVGSFPFSLRILERAVNAILDADTDIGDGKKAVVVFVPYPQLKDYRRIQVSLVGELEKKLSGKHVFVLAQRRIIPKLTKTNTQKQQRRPRSRTLTAVHDAILDDVVYPSEVTGRRVRIHLDGSRHQKVTLDPKESAYFEGKLTTISAVYKKLTGKDVSFVFPPTKE